MECCYPGDCREYSVTPVLVSANCPTKCCDGPPQCFPCLPRCPKGQMYCCEKKRSHTPPRPPSREEVCYIPRECCSKPRRSPSSPPPTRKTSNTSPHCCTSCGQPTCKPVKTKYVIPCYRYEDGRINQPTVLMRRACEVAVGCRPRKKPFVVSSYAADPYKEERQFHSEDDRGNCCFHFERKKPVFEPHHHQHRQMKMCHSSSGCTPCGPCHPCQPCTSSPQCQYVDCVYAQPVESTPPCCYYC